jgi:hypothetical protein
MLTQLSTVKSRLGLLETDTQFDSLLVNAIRAISERFDKECNRTFARTENFTQEFPADFTEICAACYPLESVSKFELKYDEAGGWLDQGQVSFLIRQKCIIALAAPLSRLESRPVTARVTCTGGFVLPGATPEPGQTPLPSAVEQAAVEQVAYWFQNRDRFGLLRIWEYHGTYRHFADLDLLQSVRAVLFQHMRWEV